MACPGPRGGVVRKSRFSEEQIIAIQKESESGVGTEELFRRHGITRAGFYSWEGKFGGMEVSEARRLRALEEENRQLKHIVAEQAVDIRALKAVVTKKW
jgi:putative transposase